MGIRTSPRNPAVDPFFSQVALLCFAVFFLWLSQGPCVFHYAGAIMTLFLWAFVLTYFHRVIVFPTDPLGPKHGGRWNQMRLVLENSKRLSRTNLPEALRAPNRWRTSCIVFFDAKSDVPLR